mmetsp:Transcript_8168/g.21455  ORF Transcript_8168/g.21455 Transcript_8168/m.21455 type:complete len:329 (+) Transcript_8168:62-1048(+)
MRIVQPPHHHPLLLRHHPHHLPVSALELVPDIDVPRGGKLPVSKDIMRPRQRNRAAIRRVQPHKGIHLLGVPVGEEKDERDGGFDAFASSRGDEITDPELVDAGGGGQPRAVHHGGCGEAGVVGVGEVFVEGVAAGLGEGAGDFVAGHVGGEEDEGAFLDADGFVVAAEEVVGDGAGLEEGEPCPVGGHRAGPADEVVGGVAADEGADEAAADEDGDGDDVGDFAGPGGVAGEVGDVEDSLSTGIVAVFEDDGGAVEDGGVRAVERGVEPQLVGAEHVLAGEEVVLVVLVVLAVDDGEVLGADGRSRDGEEERHEQDGGHWTAKGGHY